MFLEPPRFPGREVRLGERKSVGVSSAFTIVTVALLRTTVSPGSPYDALNKGTAGVLGQVEDDNIAAPGDSEVV